METVWFTNSKTKLRICCLKKDVRAVLESGPNTIIKLGTDIELYVDEMAIDEPYDVVLSKLGWIPT